MAVGRGRVDCLRGSGAYDPRMRRRANLSGGQLWSWLWGTVTLVLAGVLAVLVATSGDDPIPTSSESVGNIVSLVDGLGAKGDPSGEGLSRPSLAARSGIIAPADGRAEVPVATVDGAGRRLFGGVTVRLPSGRSRYVLRQVGPADLKSASQRDAFFLRWDGYVAVLTAAQARQGSLPARLPWRKATRSGITVPPGAAVRLRTMFRIPASAGRCAGSPASPSDSGNRRRLALKRPPAWLIRSESRGSAWKWVRSETPRSAGQLRAVRSGPSGTVIFRATPKCIAPQSSIEIDPDPDELGTGTAGTGRSLPLDTPDPF